MSEPTELHGLLAEFDGPGPLVEASERVRDEGYTRWDTYAPFPVHGLDKAMGLRDSRLPWFTLIAGVTGCAAAILMQWWMNAKDYELLISGKPPFSLPAFIPIAFEMTVLFAAIATVVGLLLLTDLPRLYHPAFRSSRFRKVTTNGFFISIDFEDPQFDPENTEAFLRSLGCTSLERLED